MVAKRFQRQLAEDLELHNAIQNVYLDLSHDGLD